MSVILLILERKIRTENLANLLEDSQKILYFLSFLMYGRQAGHRIRPWQTADFAAFFMMLVLSGYRS